MSDMPAVELLLRGNTLVHIRHASKENAVASVRAIRLDLYKGTLRAVVGEEVTTGDQVIVLGCDVLSVRAVRM